MCCPACQPSITTLYFLWRRHGAVGIEADKERVTQLLSELEGKNLQELIAAGSQRLASVPSGGGGGAAAAAPAAAAAAAPKADDKKKKEEPKEEEEEEVSQGFGGIWGGRGAGLGHPLREREDIDAVKEGDGSSRRK